MQSRGSLRTPQGPGQGEAVPSNLRVKWGRLTWWKVKVALGLQFVSEPGNPTRMVADQAPSHLQGDTERWETFQLRVLKSRSLLPSPSLVCPELKIFVAYVVWVYKARRDLCLQASSLT